MASEFACLLAISWMKQLVLLFVFLLCFLLFSFPKVSRFTILLELVDFHTHLGTGLKGVNF